MPRCVAIGCNNNGNHSFPKDMRMKKLWEKATKIRNFKVSANSRLCSSHFKETDFQGISASTGQLQVHRHLKKTAIPSVFSWNKTNSSTSTPREQRYIRRHSRRELFLETTQELSVDYDVQPLTQESLDTVPEPALEVEISTTECEAAECTSQMPVKKNIFKSNVSYNICRLFSFDDILSDSNSVLFYTGLENINKFYLVLSTLLPMANHLHYKGSQVLNMSIEDQFLLLLIKLRRNKEDFELAKIFGISKTEVGNIFITWINFVYELWSNVKIWPDRNLINYYMPQTFKQYHPSTRVIVDATEIFITKPTNPTAQQATFSSYKHHNTVKFLVGATPGGLLSFCSEGYAGSISDRQLTERSALINLCEENDLILADRGFNVQDLFEHTNVSVKTPTFLRGLTQLPGVKLKHDRHLSKNRIHIERLIGLTKTYKILKTDINPFYVPLLSRIFYICVMLCNFKEGIMKENK